MKHAPASRICLAADAGACVPPALAGGARLPLGFGGVSPATVSPREVADGVLALVLALAASPLVHNGVLLPAAESSRFVPGGALLPLSISSSAAAVLSPPARLPFALPAAAVQLPALLDSRHLVVLSMSAAADCCALQAIRTVRTGDLSRALGLRS